MDKRLLDIHNGYNYRDIGGYKTTSGKTVKWHKIVRAGNLATLSKNDQQCLINYGVKEDIDLRSNQERQNDPDRIPKGVNYHFSPIFNSKHDNRIDNLKKLYSKDPKIGYRNMIRTYQILVSSSEARHGYRKLFQALLNNEGEQTLLFHCSQGKDRTGIGAALLLLILGVDVKTVKKDYMISQKMMVPYVKMKLKQIEKYHVNDNFKQNISDLYTVHGGYFDAAMDTIKERYVNIHNFARQFLNLSDRDIKTLKQIYLTN
ncbi:protein-tyrosine-phosphatase [Philodulcilactobacillus myokoensis]|uniref:Protein-tyrosine-phosphatase n=1 Tax=Philodulcilactobacillus myokoensis TaxID=2929573 RepID=A0A9W6ETJ8_9LACO|nr:tyrosine-protein phosphatase [Philodulcilactobacillus myokoensis]GLB47303.1 protein-tyrosine-phosphatase [Philodulcilactobacillus myokoensis]